MSATPLPPIPELLTVPSGSQVYDALMFDIEPELLTENLDHLDDNHAAESPAQRTARYKRYEQAFAQYDVAFNQWIIDLSAAVQQYKREGSKTAEAKAREEDIVQLHALEEQFNALQNPSLA